jgi:NTP pyrophosphatase (non-canonical NTP hydrolase)
MHIKELCKKAHKMAVQKGFWEKKERNIAELLMLIVSELGESCEALRREDRQGNEYIKGEPTDPKIWRKDTFEDEICDTFIRLADLCEALDINIEWQIQKKMSYNKTRPIRHGKKF